MEIVLFERNNLSWLTLYYLQLKDTQVFQIWPHLDKVCFGMGYFGG